MNPRMGDLGEEQVFDTEAEALTEFPLIGLAS